MRRIAVTGATSMLGIALIEECIKKNIEVLAIVKPNSANLARLPQTEFINIVESELDDLKNIRMPEKGYDVFYHFGWTGTSKEKRNDAEEQNKNIKYTLDAVRLGRKIGCHTFIGAGSQAEYGRVDGIISPNTPVNPDNAYGIAKYAAGKLSGILCKEIGLKYIWTRIFSVYGIHDKHNTMIMYGIKEFLKERKPSFTKCEQMWDYLYSEDAGRAFYLIGEKGKDQSVYCIGSGVTRPLLDYVNTIRDAINKELPIGIGDYPYASNQVMNICADITNLKKDTGFESQYDFEEGIEKTISWIKNVIIRSTYQ